MSETQVTLTIIVLVISGLAFLLLEIITPMFGVLVGLGLMALSGAVWLAFTVSQLMGMLMLFAMVIVIPAYLVLVVKFLPRSPLGRRMFLGKAPEATAAATPEAPRHEVLVGKEGVAETPLRPSGAIRIDGQRVIATAETDMIEPGDTVKVIRAHGSNVVVRKAEHA